jgi:hypothetical protein
MIKTPNSCKNAGFRDLWVRRNEEHHLKLRGRADRYFGLVHDLLNLAKLYRPWLAAGRKLAPGFEAIYFNEQNGLPRRRR